jgi:phosphoribosylformimino-5-aminoimidazole carboxamide ribotide isomerase
LKIVPVMDIKTGRVVHAVKGEREKYQPLKSVLIKSAEPIEVALMFKSLGLRDLYVADLDAILKVGSNSTIIKDIIRKTGLHVIVDAGSSSNKNIDQLFNFGVSKVILASETMLSFNLLQIALETFGNDKIIISLDLRNSILLGGSQKISSMGPVEFASDLQEMDVTEVIVIDLARVGSSEGVDYFFLKELFTAFSGKVYVGGGIRDSADLSRLEKLGVFGVLLSTALHSGKICIRNGKVEVP